MFSWHNMTTLRAKSWHLWVPTQDLLKINPGKISAWVEMGSWSSATSWGAIDNWRLLRWGTQFSAGPLVDCPCSSGWSCTHALDSVLYRKGTWGWEEGVVERIWFEGKEQDWVWLKTHCVHKWNSQRINKNLSKREKKLKKSFLRRKLSKSQKLNQKLTQMI